MLFNSLSFAIFLPIVFCLYWALRSRPIVYQNALLIGASYVFYGWWDWRFLSLIIVSSAADFCLARRIHTAPTPARRKLYLGLSLATNLGILGFFKYCDFFIESVAALVTALGMRPNLSTLGIIVPVGISFYTFQTLGYTIDVYRGRLTPTRDAVAFFAFVSFFPQLVAGPIERAPRLLGQFLAPRRFDDGRASDGLRQMLWGLFKKVVVADNLALHVDKVFADVGHYTTAALLTAAFYFVIQVYCDFSGYSDIAIGCGRLFGFDLMRNFAYPLFASSPREFWRRWHISLSTWFRDYVYLPLGGGRCSRPRRSLNVLIVFAVSGLWHGPSWKFIAWGLLSGLVLVLTDRAGRAEPLPAERLLPSLAEWAGMLLTVGSVTLTWVFFRAESIGQGISFLERMLTTAMEPGQPVGTSGLWVISAALLGSEWLQRTRPHGLDVARLSRPVRWLIYLVVITVILWFGDFQAHEFIYFEF